MAVVIDDVAQYLDDNGLGTLAADIFKSFVPNTPDSCVTVLDTGGTKPDSYLPTKSPTFQIYIRSTDYSSGKAKLDSVRALLHQVANEELVSGQTYFYYILALAEGGHLGRDANGRDLFSINFQALTR